MPVMGKPNILPFYPQGMGLVTLIRHFGKARRFSSFFIKIILAC